MSRRAILASASACLALLLAPSSALALRCTDAGDLLTTYQTSYVHPGGTESVRIESAATLREEVTAARITFNGRIVPFDDRPEGSVTIRLAAPRSSGRHIIVVEWEQEPAGRAPCSGKDELYMRVLPRASRIGDELRPRVGGRWRMTFTPSNYDGPTVRSVWTMRPACAAGACAIKARSTTGRSYDFRLRGGRWLATRPTSGVIGGCTRETSIGGTVLSRRRVKRAFRAYRIAATLRAESTDTNDVDAPFATKVIGVVSVYYRATPAARAIGCTSGIFRDDFTGTPVR